MKIIGSKAIRCLSFVAAGLLVHCSGVLDEDNPLPGIYYMESITVKFSPDKLLKVEAPMIEGELTVVDTTYEMYYSLAGFTGDSRADSVIDQRHFKGRYEYRGADRETLRLHNMPKVPPVYHTDWWFHRSASRLTLDKPDQTQEWIFKRHH